jgi:uncharacterized protein (DUF983 family)
MLLSSARPSAPLLIAALGARCPRCGKGKLFDGGYLTVTPACSICGLKLAGNDTGDGPAFFIMLPLCIMASMFALLFEFNFTPPLWVHILVWPVFIGLIVGFSLRPVKALMVALQYRYRDVEREGQHKS